MQQQPPTGVKYTDPKSQEIAMKFVVVVSAFKPLTISRRNNIRNEIGFQIRRLKYTLVNKKNY